MGYRLNYPEVSYSTVKEIYRKSLRQPIHAYGFFVELSELHERRRPIDTLDPSISIIDDMSAMLWDMKSQLIATGLHELSIPVIPTPKKFRTNDAAAYGWLVILGTGFDEKLHVPTPDGLKERVRAILGVDEEPGWWTMRLFSYPHPNLWLEYEYPKQCVKG
ncbi:unnamed protein product [Rhizoctonia solani]|uniref:Uncharacterized protein n=1 Tax=Rhizoctonia solani TaxID=456999 RepID=A0A8H3BR96_9AGAM|nr:unnamed protein product [Rhizoctonia solani]